MNLSDLYQFLPSRIRGVYLYDQNFAISDDKDAMDFVEQKLKFLPAKQYKDIFKGYMNVGLITKQSLKETIVLDSHFQRNNPDKYRQYFEKYFYFSNQLDDEHGDDNNYLEAKFVKKVLAPILSTWGILQVKPQVDICGYTVDFAVEGDKKYIFEIDGFGKFRQRQDLDDFLWRQNDIVNDGWTIFRFSYSHIMSPKYIGNTKKCIYSIFAHDVQLRDLLERPPQHNIFENFNSFASISPIQFVNDYYKIQDVFVQSILQKNTGTIVIRDSLNYPFPIVPLSLSHLYKFLSEIEKLLEISFAMPDITVAYESLYQENYEHYFDERIKIESIAEIKTQEYAISNESLSASPSSDHLFYQGFPDISFRSWLTSQDIKNSLYYITSSIFRFENGTKGFQNDVLQSIFNKKNVLGIFPTGSGKSFCFWLPALLKPGLTLVICPLRSLMQDQIMTMEDYGIASAAFINSDIDKSQQKKILHDAKMGKIKILYVAPERIRIRDFVDAFDELQEFVPINYLVIDEAHCISEWGHDFRPAYLNIPQFYESIKAKNPQVQIIALTATAGDTVKKDITNILKLQEGGEVRIGPDLDRQCFSYQIVQVDGHKEKHRKFKDIITHWIPKALDKLGVSDIHDVLGHENHRGEKAVGLIYVIYADPHGKHSIEDGIANYLYETKRLIEPDFFNGRENKSFDPKKDYSHGRVRAFSSKIPTLCPKCYSYKYTSYQNTIIQGNLFEELDNDDEGEDTRGIPGKQAKKGEKICEDCGHRFKVEKNNKGTANPFAYPKSTRQNQYDFKHSVCDILVATKGFGMGIDKGSVRFALHTSFASGIESWYQEAGRAGRDEERAHCVIIADTPNERCLSQLNTIEGAKIPGCTQRRCPHGKQAPCDYGKQHLMIKRSYPSVEADVVSSIRTLDRVITAFLSKPINENKITIESNRNNLGRDELALFRLKLLGIVKEFSVYYVGRTPNFEITIYTEPTDDGKITIRTKDEEIQSNLAVYLNNNRLYTLRQVEVRDGKLWRIGQNRDIITQCKEKYDKNIVQRLEELNLEKKINKYTEYRGYYHRLVDYLLVILDHTYDEILRMRYQMLWVLLNVIIGHECRRRDILPHFGTLLGEKYKCELCDNCVPDLQFTRSERVPPKDTKMPEELLKGLKDAFEGDTFKYDDLVRLRGAFAEYPGDMKRRSESILSGNPDNMVALYFLREFSSPEEKESNTKFLIRQANIFLLFEDIAKLFDSSDERYKRDLIVILDDEDGRFNNSEGITWLYDNGRQIGKRGDFQLKKMLERFGFYFFVIDFEEKHSHYIKALKNQIREAYYGGNN